MLTSLFHERLVLERRVHRLSDILASRLPACTTLLDVGCGDGQISRAVVALRPEVEVTGIDVLVRPDTAVPVTQYDGVTIPFGDRSFDIVMMVDVLHHTSDPFLVLAEAARVARTGLLIKDHCCDGFLARPTLRFMDHIGNHRHGVALPYTYWSEKAWRAAFATLDLEIVDWASHLGIYGLPLSLVFGRSLHYVALLEHLDPTGPRRPER